MSTSPYIAAGKLLDQMLLERKGLKSLVYSSKSSKLTCTKTTYAQVCHTLQYKKTIDLILHYGHDKLYKAIQFDETRSKGLLYVLLYELLFGKFQSIRGGGKVKRNIIKMEKQLREVGEIIVASQKDVESKIPLFPRYVRVNTLKTSLKEVILFLRKETASAVNETSREDFDIYVDIHVPNLLVLSPHFPVQWHESELVRSGKIVLQDKSSCFSALVLAHGSNNDSGANDATAGDYIDACAAPGNKTSHLAALLSLQLEQEVQCKTKKQAKKKNELNHCNRIKVFAFDRSASRVAILKERLLQMIPAECSVNVVPVHQDFLTVDPSNKDYANVRSILLDPSCSGSGIVNNPDRFLNLSSGENDKNDDQKTANRIDTLANFQVVALKHSMSFPQVNRIVYSTCSVHNEENEHVVATALLESNTHIKEENRRWQLVAPLALRHWKRRGRAVAGLTEEQASCLIRVDGMDGDDTNGFFVSYFERRNGKDCVAINNRDKDESTSLICLPDGVEIYKGEFETHQVSEDCLLPCNSNVDKIRELEGVYLMKEEKKDLENADDRNKKKRKKSKNENLQSVAKNDILQKPLTKKSENGKTHSLRETVRKHKTQKSLVKKTKKLAWKKKQQDLKLARLQKKKITETTK